MQSNPADLKANSFRLEPVWIVRAELAARDDARVREAVAAAVGLHYGKYDRVAFESAEGVQFFHSLEGSHSGEGGGTISMPARVLSFSIAQDQQLLQSALEAIHQAHSYEEPVIYVMPGFASRAIYSERRDNPNRWWNRGFEF